MEYIFKIKPLIILISVIISASFFREISCKNGNAVETQESSINFTVYIVNRNMHTGIVIPADHIPYDLIAAAGFFNKYKFIDMGWGEEKYYQEPDDNLLDGARALLLRNTSVIRIEGYHGSIENLIMWSDYTVELTLSPARFVNLIKFIDRSFTRDTEGSPIITSSRHSGKIIFFKSIHTYHLFNTCNTWVADAIRAAGFDLPESPVITRMQLYNLIQSVGQTLKKPE